MLTEIASGVLSGVITQTARWMAVSAASAGRGRTVRHEAEIAAWFDTYELDAAALPEPPGDQAIAAAWLRSDATQAVLHELLAVRMTAAPEEHVERLRAKLLRTADAVGTEWADGIFDWADETIRGVVVKLEARDPQAWRAARNDSFGARIVAVLHAIERHVAVPDGDPAADDAWITRYRTQLRRAYGKIEPPDFTRRRTVPIDRLYVPPDVTQPRPNGEHESLPFDDLVARVDRSVLLGDPGGGKSTAAQVITHRWAGDEAARVPFVVVLRQFAAGDGPRGSVVAHIEERLGTFHQCPPPAGTVERLLLDRRAAVIFDGLDELIDTGRRLEVTRTIEQFCEQYPLAPVLVTSRLVGYDEARLDEAQFTRYTIAGFDEDRTRTYAANWFALDDPASAEERADAFMTESEQVADLRSNPLMLSLMCILYQGEGSLPRDRPGVYEQCSRLLFDRWDARRKIRYELRARNHIEPALRQLAYWLFTRETGTEVTERDLIAFTADYLHERGFEQRVDAEAAAREFVEFCRGRAWILSDTGTTARGEALYTFTHRTFLEYFAAYHLASVCDTPQQLARKLAPHIAQAEWEVVAQLAVQIKDQVQDRGAERFFSTLIREKRRRPEGRGNVLAFLARCLAFVEPPPTVVRDLARAVLDHFTAGDPDDPGRFGSFIDLIAHGDAWDEAIGEEIFGAADREVTADASRGTRALLWIAFFVAVGGVHDHAASWTEVRNVLAHRYGRAILQLARTDDRAWMASIASSRGAPLRTFTEALAQRDRLPAVLLAEIPAGVFGVIWGSLGVSYVGSLRAGDQQVTETIEDCASLGTWCKARQPPFFIYTDPTRAGRFDDPPVPASLHADADAYLGFAMLMTGMLELQQTERPDLEQLIADYPDGTMPEPFLTWFRRWARREIDFVEILPDPPASTGPVR